MSVFLQQGISDLAGKLAKGIPEGQTMTVAVTDFPDLGGRTCGLGRYIPERLSTLMSQYPQSRLIERRRLEMVLQELKFSMSEIVDPAKAIKLGQMLGVQGLVIGTVSDVGGTIDLDARIINIQTSVSLPGALANIVKDEAVKQLSSDCVGGAASAVGTDQAAGSPLTVPTTNILPGLKSAVRKVVDQGFTFELQSCVRSGTAVTCMLAVTSNGEDKNVWIYGAWTPHLPVESLTT